jgi:hypothetical protein
MSRLLALAVVAALMTLGTVAHAQDPQVVLRATAGSRPEVLVWVDPPGITRTETHEDTAYFEDLFASTNWLWLDDGVLLIRRGETELVASALYRALDDTNTFWALHNRRQEYTLDGSADVDPNDRTTGGATLYVTLPPENGETITARVEVTLTFQR